VLPLAPLPPPVLPLALAPHPAPLPAPRAATRLAKPTRRRKTACLPGLRRRPSDAAGARHDVESPFFKKLPMGNRTFSERARAGGCDWRFVGWPRDGVSIRAF
jgi:hypothetical protein